MIERAPGIYEVALRSNEGKGVGEIRIFLIPGHDGERSLMVDAGFGEEVCFDQMMEALKELNLECSSLDIFLTHKHHDHCGLASAFAEMGARLFMNPEEDRHHYDCLYYHKSHDAMEEQIKVLRTVGVTEEKTPEIWKKFMEINERVGKRHERWAWVIEDYPYRPVYQGQLFRYGDYSFRAIGLKGHTYGQMGLYDDEHRIVFTADQILNGIVPIVATTHADEHMLEAYFASLEHLKSHYRGCLILPAHKGPIENVSGVVEHIASAYLDKLDIIDGIIRNAGQMMTVQQTAFLAYGIRKNPTGDDEFMKMKMVISKTFSCLEYLYAKGFVTRENRDGTLYWGDAKR